MKFTNLVLILISYFTKLDTFYCKLSVPRVGEAEGRGTQRCMTLTKKAPLSEVHVLLFKNQSRRSDFAVLLVSG